VRGPLKKILTVFAGSLLALYTVKLIHEYMTDDGDDDDKEAEGNETDGGVTTGGEGMANDQDDHSDGELSTTASSMELGEISPNKKLLDFPEGVVNVPGFLPFNNLLDEQVSTRQRAMSDVEKLQTVDKKRQQTLFVIAFIGSIDDLTLFVPMLVGKGFDWLQLVLGAIVAASTIVMICLFIGLCKPVADFLSNIPLAAIVAVFSTTLLIKGTTMA